MDGIGAQMVAGFWRGDLEIRNGFIASQHPDEAAGCHGVALPGGLAWKRWAPSPEVVLCRSCEIPPLPVSGSSCNSCWAELIETGRIEMSLHCLLLMTGIGRREFEVRQQPMKGLPSTEGRKRPGLASFNGS
jgi:hypothetical protein